MTQGFRFNTARELFEAFPEAERDISAPPSDQDPVSFANALLASATPENAVTFCAYLLPRREAVWWGHQCLHRLPDTFEDGDAYYLDLAEGWVRDPDEGPRRAALEAGMRPRNKTPAVWIALAAGWTGGSMLPPNEPVVPPPAHLTAKAVNTAILSTLAKVDRRDRAGMLATFVRMALHLLTHA
jgi:hypothetical protein